MAQLIKDSMITFNKSGSGSKSGRLTIPPDWLRALGINDENDENRKVEIIFENEKIIVKKK